MEQYIPKSAVVTEIERKHNQEVQWMERQGYTEYNQGLRDGYTNILSFLNTLETKEINSESLDEKAIAKYLYEKKGYPITLNGNLPSYEETMKSVNQYINYKKEQFIEKAKEAFCKAMCNGHPPRSTCTSLGTCKEHDNFVKFLKGK